MDDTQSALPTWLLNEHVAQLSYGTLAGRVDAARPGAGLQLDKIAGGLLSVFRTFESPSTDNENARGDTTLWPLPIADVYIRGNDLVATYLAVEAWPYSPQVYWRAAALDAVDGVRASLSLIVSMQTQLLDTCPQITVSSQALSKGTLGLVITEGGDAEIGPINGGNWEAPRGTTYCIIRRLSKSPLSLIEFASSSDYLAVRSRPDSHGNTLSEWRLFAEFLEKGVIRRARVNSALVPQENDIELAVECSRAMENLPLPLTT
jgi:hypothetical protein